MPRRTFRTPGVYIEEIGSIPPAVAPVETAIPAFVGYTPQASDRGISVLNKAKRITSLLECETIFGYASNTNASDPNSRQDPQYYLVESAGQRPSQPTLTIAGKHYLLQPDPDTVYYLYPSIRLFFQNGGKTAYIVSIGTYGPASGASASPGATITNCNVSIKALQKGLKILESEKQVTLYAFPDASLLPSAENGIIIREALAQNERLGNSMSIIDVAEGARRNPQNSQTDIDSFRNRIGSNGLRNGAAYYPFLDTTILDREDLSYNNLFGGDVKKLIDILSPANDPNPEVVRILKDIVRSSKRKTSFKQYHDKLLSASSAYQAIMDSMLQEVNRLPPSGALAGVFVANDERTGVWKAPANIALTGVSKPTIQVDQPTQEYMNIDPTSGRSVNAIRSIPRRGVIPWGARTLDSNDPESRYISARRTIQFIESSCTPAIRGFAFEENVPSTWKNIETVIENFLLMIWRQGGLAGSKASEAFSVRCGLNTSMTSQDITNGELIVIVGISLTRPAEFTVLTLRQKIAQ
ncbi:hypothetical protein [Pelagicoccus sp. SDUM812002]|uniref:phage tail sheath family protein n=1 Tax=Pelagicoccus sp. SDUM812002 TaxID=3041266 RepID=UPI0028101A9F|nr:hypothetical protein [Pelagicoccus sp. SDUM812002]MDQ8186791.1 hypothetical protein [Pelagicoccus sp. SDUM812002]